VSDDWESIWKETVVT